MFEELEKFGVSRHFAEALLFFGKEFVDSEVKISPANSKEAREEKLAEKYKARVWESVPMKGDKVGIKVLLKKT